MTIITDNQTLFTLQKSQGEELGRLQYNSTEFANAVITAGTSSRLLKYSAGEWKTLISQKGTEKTIASIKVKPGAVITLKIEHRRQKYLFRKSDNWKLRFTLCNKEGEELLTILPSVNWEKESHDYVLQLNEEYEKECDAFLILQAVHCANLSMSMMTGGKVPALISI